jgi:hypothetical protein
VLIDPQQPKRVYAVATTGIAYGSDDAGRTWSLANRGLPRGGIVALTLDPRHPTRLYASTATETLYLSDDGAGSWRTLTR